MAPRVTAVAASILIPVTTLAATACSRADASATKDADHAAVAVVTHAAVPSTRTWSTSASGIVQANTTVDIAFQVPGKVVSVGPDEGQVVHAGQELATLDATEYRLAVEQAAAQSDRAARDRDRNRPLLAAGAIAPADMDHLESGARQSAAAVDLAKKRLADTRLDAPISGIIARRAIEVGATVAPGQPALTIVDLDPVRVRVGVPEADVGHIATGAMAMVRIPALDTTFAGRVSLVGVSADPSTRSYTVEISVPNRARRLRAGMVAEATIESKESRATLMVPASAVLHDGGVNGSTIVYVLDGDGARVHSRRVVTGLARGDSLEIASGLDAGEQVVVAGQQRLRDGVSVQRSESKTLAKATTGGVQP